MTHVPVMREPILQAVRDYIVCEKAPEAPLRILDATFGRGGHTTAFLQAFSQAHVTAVDRDDQAVQAAYTLSSHYPGRLTVHHTPFSAIAALFPVPFFDVILFDFGVSSPQLDTPDRGFSFMHDGPLDMRMDSGQTLTAADIVNTWPQEQLADLFFAYADERASRKIARLIVYDRQKKPFETTGELAGMLYRVLGRGSRGHHPATRVFQALRMAVNQEPQEISHALPASAQALMTPGLLMTLCFHSYEDRMAKNFFKIPGTFRAISKKPLRADAAESALNPRSRSACLRWGVR